MEYPATGMTHCPFCGDEFRGEVKKDGTIGFNCTPFECGRRPYRAVPGKLPAPWGGSWD